MRRSLLWLAPALLAAGCDRQSGGGGQGNATLANDVAAISPDEVQPAAGGAAASTPAGKLDRSHAGTRAPSYPFLDAKGKVLTLQAIKGPVLLNLWATWCGPCVKELPTLNTLATREGGKLTVVALSQDNDAGKAAPFLAERHLAALGGYTDASMRWVPAITATLPTSIFFGADGKERWRYTGDRDWAGADAAKDLAER